VGNHAKLGASIGRLGDTDRASGERP
jgi:hypothetical protein